MSRDYSRAYRDTYMREIEVLVCGTHCHIGVGDTEAS